MYFPCCTVFLGVDNVGKNNNPMKNKAISEEKRALLSKMVGRWITQTNIPARHGRSASKLIGSEVGQWAPAAIPYFIWLKVFATTGVLVPWK